MQLLGIIEQYIASLSQSLGISETLVSIILAIVFLWTIVWKLLGLWKSARNGALVWFIIIAIFNTIGILPILYIYVFSKRSKEVLKKKAVSKKKIGKKKKVGKKK
ncbi:DUF5652 family protein [Nanoarchaeota archaeon]